MTRSEKDDFIKQLIEFLGEVVRRMGGASAT
jgi:hypothetical protein